MRLLLVGGGERGLRLCRTLTADGHAVRVVTRDPERHDAIRAAGGEPWDGDPDRIGTLRYALDNVTILLWALGTATGDEASVRALHATRLEMLLERTIDTTVRGVLYECSGTLPVELLSQGARIVERLCRHNEIPWGLLYHEPSDPDGWAASAAGAIEQILSRDRG
ncbi:MAG: NAD(P)H-binding protein [Solirubrobacteraceae bacterium]